jgi:hypothetical protein
MGGARIEDLGLLPENPSWEIGLTEVLFTGMEAALDKHGLKTVLCEEDSER